MSFDNVRSGAVIRYPYLWARQAADGETEGRKERPTVVALRLERPDGDTVFLFPITTSPPPADRWAVELPDSEKAAAGLDVDRRQWLVLDEFNEDIVGQSYYLGRQPTVGELSARFLVPIVREIIARRAELTPVSRR